MNSSIAEHLTDTEAEAVLLALGGPILSWQENGPEGYVIALAQTTSYAIMRSEGFLKPLLLVVSLVFKSPSLRALSCRYCVCHRPDYKNAAYLRYKFFRHFDEAKAACERHYATGKWD